MSLQEQLMQELKTSMKNKDNVRKNAIILIRSAIKQTEVDERREVTEEDIIDIISKQYKEKKQVIEEFKRGNRSDLVEMTEREMDILLEFLPKQLSDEEVEEIVRETIEEVGATSMKDIGLIMKSVMPKVKGKADGNLVNQTIRKIFS
ncbi:MAG: GatB/YqeY domain-containing protein [Tissierellia bacterium]|nr:GatB/YqeY domain-containing protein [Tissierellia bacterium]